MDPARGDAKSERKEEEKQAKRQESVSSSDNDDGEDDFFQLDQELTNPFLGHLNDGRIATSSPQSADGRLSSPPVQMMWRSPDAPDQNRIPSSIFDRPSSPKEWSAASNESLFSIHGGNSSFTRDHIGLMEKSGELNLPEEDHHHHSPRALPADPAGAETDNAKSIKELVQANAEEQQHRSSDCSAVSYQSFAFPMYHHRPSLAAARSRITSINLKFKH